MEVGLGRRYPYKVIASSLVLSDTTFFKVFFEDGEKRSDWVQKSERNNPYKCKHIDDKVVLVVERNLILSELAILIDMEKFVRLPCCCVKKISPDIPPTISVRLKFMPKGSRIESPIFDGSLLVE